MPKAVRQRPVKKKAAKAKRPPPAPKSSSMKANGNPVFLIDENEVGINNLVRFGQCPEPNAVHTITNFPELIGMLEGFANTEPDSSSDLPRLAGVVYGPSGVGKTSFCANFGEDTIVIDSATGMQHLCFDHCCTEEYDGDWTARGFYSFQQGPATAGDRYWEPQFLRTLTHCANAGWNVLVIAHSELKRYEDPEGPGYERFTPYLHKQCWQRLHRWAGMVLFYNYSVNVEKQGTKEKPDLSSEQRFINTVRTAAYDAKNQYGLPVAIEAGEGGKEAYDNFMEAYKDCLV